MMGETPTTGARPATSASRRPVTARIGAMLTTGLLGASSTTSASARRVQHTGRGLGGVGADEDEPLRRQLAAVAHPPLLEVHRTLFRRPRRGSLAGRPMAGSILTPGCQRAQSASVTAERG